MDIWSLMDCEGCEDCYIHRGCTFLDPDRCYPDSVECKRRAPESGPCDRMLDAIEKHLIEGQLETPDGGWFADREFLMDDQEDENNEYKNFDFSSSPFWLMSHVGPVPYHNAKEIYADFFAA